MRVILIMPQQNRATFSQCIGLGYLSSYLRATGHMLKLVDIGARTRRDLDRIAQEFQPEVVGVSVFCGGYDGALDVARYFRDSWPRAAIVAGGPLASFIPAELLRTQLFDYVVCGPGEVAMTALLSRLSEGRENPDINIPGVASAQNPNPSEFGLPVECIDSVPFPEQDQDAVYVNRGTLIASRGCNQHCIFCVSALRKAPLQLRSVDNIMAEIEYLRRRYNPSMLSWLDDNFAVDQGRTHLLCESMRREDVPPWGCHIRADIDCDTLSLMAEAGCVEVGIGVESGNQDVLNRIGKRLDLARVDKIVEHARAMGVGVLCYYILGHYCDTPETMEDTLAHARHLKERYGALLRISVNTLFPGSPQYVHRDRLGLCSHASRWDDYRTDRPTASGRGFTIDELRSSYFAAGELMGPFFEALHAAQTM